MPELPEVETVANKLNPKIKGKLLKGFKILDHKLALPPISLSGFKIRKVSRFGKEVLIELFKKDDKSLLYLLVHLRMTGRLLFQKGSFKKMQEVDSENYLRHKVIRINSDNFSKHVRAVFHLTEGNLYFFDVRRFGTFKWSNQEPALAAGTIDPIKTELTKNILSNLLTSSKKLSLKAFLLRQDKIVGIGNIYASEILYLAKISPQRVTATLNPSEIARLTAAITKVLKSAIAHNGTTISDFQHDDSETGEFQNFLKVYGRDGKPCKRCKTSISKITQNQRSTFYCEFCQN